MHVSDTFWRTQCFENRRTDDYLLEDIMPNPIYTHRVIKNVTYREWCLVHEEVSVYVCPIHHPKYSLICLNGSEQE